MMTNLFPSRLLVGATAVTSAMLCLNSAFAQNPWADSWLTSPSGSYARIYQSTAALNAGNASVTWSRGQGVQNTPVYAGVQAVYLSEDWVYIKTSGLGFHTMGPWYLNAAKTQDFGNFPANAASIHRFPRNPGVPVEKTLTGAGVIGYFVDGVAMFDNRDTFSYTNASGQDANPVNGLRGDGIWNRDAYINEGVTFDPAFAHQAGATYHYHANPPALRHRLGDHVEFNENTGLYSEANSVPEHSPILGWVNDGHPIYGPYGYSDANDPNSEVRRMISGYIKRDGSHGSANLNQTGRTTLPQWAADAQNRSVDLTSSQFGPAVSAEYILGHYLEDYDYLGDLGRTQGTDFDLDEYNGRFCATPEFPDGVYAYFVSIESDGTPAFPYNINRFFHGDPVGASVGEIEDGAVLVFEGGANRPVEAGISKNDGSVNGPITLRWNGAEGGSYVIEKSETPSGSNWTEIASAKLSGTISGEITDNEASATAAFYRIRQTDIDPFDETEFGATNGGGNGGGNNGGGGMTGNITSVTPNTGSPGQQISITIMLDGSAQPPLPPANVPVQSLTVGTYTINGAQRVSQTEIQATWTIPTNAAAGTYTVTVELPGPPGSDTPFVLTRTEGFTITSGN